MFRIGCEYDSDIVGAKGVDILNCIVSIDSNVAGIEFSPNACNKRAMSSMIIVYELSIEDCPVQGVASPAI